LCTPPFQFSCPNLKVRSSSIQVRKT
jgi:hypothetical protein